MRFDFWGPGVEDIDNMRFGTADRVTTTRFRNDLNMVPIDPPLTVAEGDGVTLRIAYDLDAAYFAGPQEPGTPPVGGDVARWYCGETAPGAATVDGCFYFDLFRPALVVEAAPAP